MRIDDLLAFMQARHAIYLKRKMNLPKPWTQDKILQRYRFCNVYRELDKETIWIKDNWRTPLLGHPNLFFAMLVARLVNWSGTLAELKRPVPRWDRDNFTDVLHSRADRGEKVWTGAYMITTHRQPVDKAEYYAHILDDIWACRDDIRPREGDTLATFHARLAECYGIGSFLAAQVVADTKYGDTLRHAKDWSSWAAIGEGSRRGMNRVMRRPYKQRGSVEHWRVELGTLQDRVNLSLAPLGLPFIDAQNLQNCLCEFDKYERVRLGQGRPRSTYQGV